MFRIYYGKNMAGEPVMSPESKDKNKIIGWYKGLKHLSKYANLEMLKDGEWKRVKLKENNG